MDAPQPLGTVRKKKPIYTIIFWLAIVVLANVLAYQVWLQIDLTRDKRYSIHQRTQDMLRQVEDPIHVRLFLTGDKLPSSFKRLSQAAEEMLRNFRDLSRNKVEYTVIDPMQADTSLLNEMSYWGISNFPVTIAEGKGKTTQIPVTPYALVELGDRKVPVLLQSYKSSRLSEEDFNQSIIKLEYNLAQAIKQVRKANKDSVLYLLGNEQSGGYEVFQLANELNARYVFHVDTLQRITAIPNQYKAVIINQPKAAFTENDKFKLDQYLMQGGNLLYNIKTTTASFDSLMLKQAFTAIPIELDLTNLLFSYGIRLGNTVVSDLDQCIDIPLQHEDNSVSQSEIFPWPYFPIYTGNEAHPITRNISEVLGKFPGAIELVNDQSGVNRTVLLHTSNYSKMETAPLLIDVTTVLFQPERHSFNKKNIPIAVLSEGIFTSVYRDRLPEVIQSDATSILRKSEKPGKVAVFADGDIFNNEVSQQSGPREMGTYLFSPYVFDNRNLLLNTLEYMTDSLNLLDVQSKSYQASLLDKRRIADESLTWQIINIGVPAVLVVLFGAVFYYVRRVRYAGKNNSTTR